MTAGSVTITPRFFDVLRMPLLRGRGFNEKDGSPGAEHVIVNQKFASQYFPGDDPIGKRFRFAQRTEWYLTTEQKKAVGVDDDRRDQSGDPSQRAESGAARDCLSAAAFDPPVYSTLLVRSGLPPPR